MTFSIRALRPPALLLAVITAVAAGFMAVTLTQSTLEDNYRALLGMQVQRDAGIVTHFTMTGHAMGAVEALGLVNPAVKSVLNAQIPADDATVLESIQAIHDAYAATGVYIVRPDGIVQSNVVSLGSNLMGDNVAFRPYFKRAMRGEKNVYVGISTTTGLRALYAAAPVYQTQSVKSQIIGVAVIRMSDDQLSKIINSWTAGPTFLISPQKIVFSSNHREWFGHMTAQPTPTEVTAIQELKQFGTGFLENKIKLLPFDLKQQTVTFEGQQYAVQSATVNWDDPNGEWKLLLLGNLKGLLPLHTLLLGTGTSTAVLLVALLMMRLRKKLVHARVKRLQAESDLKVYTSRLEAESEVKSFLADLSIVLQQTSNHADFARQLLSHVTPRMAAEYGALYVRNPDSDFLSPIGGYGVPESELAGFEWGQGLLGQAAMGAQTMLLDDAEKLPIRIRSGLGSDRPKAMLLMPVKHLDQVLGILVLASLRGFNTSHLSLQESLLPVMAIQLGILNRQLAAEKQTQTLLQQQARPY
jgi:C4-dicarboxylate-specific signal transduction histidine kinase